MKILRFETVLEIHNDFGWYILPTIKFDVFEQSLSFSWLCVSITLPKLKIKYNTKKQKYENENNKTYGVGD